MNDDKENRSAINLPPLDERIDISRLFSCTCIVIDGDPGSGKTSLAQVIAKRIDASVISMDDFLLGNGGIYWEQIDYEALRRRIASCGRKVILEGVCALKIIARIGLPYDYHIFLKTIDEYEGWECEIYLDGGEEPPQNGLIGELIQYYRELKPYDVCNLVLSRTI